MHKPDQNKYLGNFFFFFFNSMISDPRTPGILDSGDALVNVQGENCHTEDFFNVTVQNHQPCLKIVVLNRTYTLSM